MNRFLPDVSKQITSKEIFNLLELKYSEIAPVWMPIQVQWMNEAYRTFNDYEKFTIVMYLLGKTFETYGINFAKLNYDEYFNQNQIEIEKINVMQISRSLNIPKETARRKIVELEQMGTIKKLTKKIIVDRKTWPNIKPEETIQRMSRFLSILSSILYEEKIISETITSDKLVKVAKEYFSYVWKLYYEMQIPMLLNFKKIHGDLESFHVWSTCIVNQILNSKKNDNREMSKENYLIKYLYNYDQNNTGINAMSISDITGIPRATVIRKLNKLIKTKFLIVDIKKHYLTTGVHKKKLTEAQKKTFINLSKFAACIYNLSLMKN